MIGTWKPVVRSHASRQALIWDVECSRELCDATIFVGIFIHACGAMLTMFNSLSKHACMRVTGILGGDYLSLWLIVSTGVITPVPPFMFSSFFSSVVFRSFLGTSNAQVGGCDRRAISQDISA